MAEEFKKAGLVFRSFDLQILRGELIALVYARKRKLVKRKQKVDLKYFLL